MYGAAAAVNVLKYAADVPLALQTDSHHLTERGTKNVTHAHVHGMTTQYYGEKGIRSGFCLTP